MGTSTKHDSMEVIKCLMCQGDVAKAELVDHIAGKHFNYELHKCNQCDFANFDAGNAARHQRETRHQVMLNEFSYNYNEYAEEMIGKAFEDSVAASAAKKRQATSVQVSTRERVASSTRDIIPPVTTVDEEVASKIAPSDEGMPLPPIMTIPRAQKFTEIPSHHVAGAESMPPPPIKTIPPGQKFTEIPSHHVAGAGSMLPLPASTKQRVQGSSGVLHRHVSSARGKLLPAVVRIQQAQPSVKVPHPHDSSASTFAQQNLRRDQCQLCFVVVPEAVEKRNHVFNKHLDAIVLCPVSGCDFKVSSNCMSALGKIGNHVKDKHGGFKTLTSDEKTAYDENKRKRRGVAEGVYRDCFCDSPTEAKKRRVPDNFHGGGDAGLLPKMIKHE